VSLFSFILFPCLSFPLRFVSFVLCLVFFYFKLYLFTPFQGNATVLAVKNESCFASAPTQSLKVDCSAMTITNCQDATCSTSCNTAPIPTGCIKAGTSSFFLFSSSFTPPFLGSSSQKWSCSAGSKVTKYDPKTTMNMASSIVQQIKSFNKV
jgi:hypothetical protein